MKQTNRPFLAILAFALAVVLGLSACGNTAQQSNAAKSDDAAATTEETATEAFVNIRVTATSREAATSCCDSRAHSRNAAVDQRTA